MISSRLALFATGLLLLAAVVFALFTDREEDRWFDEVGAPPVPPLIPENARPALVAAAPLPQGPAFALAKPVILAEPNRLTVVAQAVSDRPLASALVQWHAMDEGNWSQPSLIPNWPKNATFVGDPWCESDRQGRVYLVHTSHHDGTLVFRRSADFARTWSEPIEVVRGADRPVCAVSPNGKYLAIAAALGELSPPANDDARVQGKGPIQAKAAVRVQFSSGIFVSQNGGRTWQRWDDPVKEGHAIAFSVAIDDEGHIASSWIVTNCDSQARQSRSVVCSTVDRGQNWTEEELVAKLQPDRKHPFNGERFPVLKLGSGGTIHAAYVTAQAKGLFVKRLKNWNQWNEPLRLSDPSAEEIRMPAINAYGSMVHVTWMERKKNRWQVYYRGSKDQGSTWCDPLLLSVPDGGSNLIDKQGFALTSDDDQSSLTDDGAGTVHAVWAVRGLPGKNAGRIWHAKIRWQDPS